MTVGPSPGTGSPEVGPAGPAGAAPAAILSSSSFAESGGPPTVSLRGVEKTYLAGPLWARRPLHAVRGVDLEIAPGETVGLVGESGSGKTTLGRLCLGMLRPTRGTVLFQGEPLERHRRALRGRFQVVLQNPDWSLDPRQRIGSSVAEPLIVAGQRRAATRRQRVAEMLALVGLDPSVADRYPHQLSGGQRQRVSIARALITDPAFIVLDEAVSALDVSIQSQVLNLVRKVQAERGFSAVFISHDLAAVRYVSHRIAVMLRGELVEVGPAARFYGTPEHPYSRQLLAATAVLAGGDLDEGAA